MEITPIKTAQTNSSEKKCKKLGMAAGAIGYVGNMARKEGIPDMFTKLPVVTPEGNVILKNLSKKGIAAKVGIIAVGAGLFAIAGKLVGGAIGRIIDNHKAKKAQKAE